MLNLSYLSMIFVNEQPFDPRRFELKRFAFANDNIGGISKSLFAQSLTLCEYLTRDEYKECERMISNLNSPKLQILLDPITKNYS